MMRFDRYLLGALQRLNSVRLPAKGAVQLLTTLFVVFLSLCLFPNLAVAASPHIYDVPQAGLPGSQTALVGNGFDPNATLDIYFDSTDVGVVVTDSDGSFGLALKAQTLRQNGLTIQIPNDAVQGQHWITAIERITEIQAQVPFTIQFDWPQSHYGPDRTGFNPYESVLSPETVGNLTILWKGTGSDASYEVANNVLYAFGSNYLYALNASTGAQLWTYPAPIGNPPAVVDGVVYFSTCDVNDLSLYAVAANSGVLLWKYPLNGCGTSPAVVNGVVYVGSLDGNVYALASTGALLWKYAAVDQVTTLAVANGAVYAGTYNGNDPFVDELYALDADTGALVWKLATPGGVEGDPTVVKGVVYFAVAFVSMNEYNTYAVNANTGALIWQYTTNGFPIGQTVANGVVYIGPGGGLYALDAATGTLLWKYTNGLNDSDMYAPAVANGVVYFGINVGQQESGAVYALNASTGALLLKYAMPSAILSSPAVVNGMVYIGSLDGNLYAFGLPQQMSEKFSPPERPDPARLTPNWSLQPNTVATPSKK